MGHSVQPLGLSLQMCVAPESAFPTRVFSLGGNSTHFVLCLRKRIYWKRAFPKTLRSVKTSEKWGSWKIDPSISVYRVGLWYFCSKIPTVSTINLYFASTLIFPGRAFYLWSAVDCMDWFLSLFAPTFCFFAFGSDCKCFLILSVKFWTAHFRFSFFKCEPLFLIMQSFSLLQCVECFTNLEEIVVAVQIKMSFLYFLSFVFNFPTSFFVYYNRFDDIPDYNLWVIAKILIENIEGVQG